MIENVEENPTEKEQAKNNEFEVLPYDLRQPFLIYTISKLLGYLDQGKNGLIVQLEMQGWKFNLIPISTEVTESKKTEEYAKHKQRLTNAALEQIERIQGVLNPDYQNQFTFYFILPEIKEISVKKPTDLQTSEKSITEFHAPELCPVRGQPNAALRLVVLGTMIGTYKHHKRELDLYNELNELLDSTEDTQVKHFLSVLCVGDNSVVIKRMTQVFDLFMMFLGDPEQEAGRLLKIKQLFDLMNQFIAYIECEMLKGEAAIAELKFNQENRYSSSTFRFKLQDALYTFGQWQQDNPDPVLPSLPWVFYSHSEAKQEEILPALPPKKIINQIKDQISKNEEIAASTGSKESLFKFSGKIKFAPKVIRDIAFLITQDDGCYISYPEEAKKLWAEIQKTVLASSSKDCNPKQNAFLSELQGPQKSLLLEIQKIIQSGSVDYHEPLEYAAEGRPLSSSGRVARLPDCFFKMDKTIDTCLSDQQKITFTGELENIKREAQEEMSGHYQNKVYTAQQLHLLSALIVIRPDSLTSLALKAFNNATMKCSLQGDVTVHAGIGEITHNF